MSTQHPLVSVVIPSYNTGHLIDRAIQSVLRQTYKEFEIIIVDNNSTDNTDDVLSSHVIPCLSVQKVDNQGSIAFSRNCGVRAARGEWIAFLDSDDWWSPHKLAECSRHFASSDLIYHPLLISRHNHLHFPASHSPTWRLKKPVFSHLLLTGNPIPTSSVVVRRSVFQQIGGFNESKELIAAEDYEAWLRLATASDRFFFLNKTLGFYQYTPTSVSRRDMSIPMRAVYALYSHQISSAEYLRMDANAAYAAGRYAYQKNIYRVATSELKSSFLYGRPTLKIKSLGLLIASLFKCLPTLLTRHPYS